MTFDKEDIGPDLKDRLLYSIQSLCEIGEELSSIDRFENSSQMVLHLIMGTLVISKAAILLYDEEKKELVISSSRGVDENISVPIESNVLNSLHHINEPILWDNPDHEVFKKYKEKNQHVLDSLHSHIWFSLKVKSRFLGVISISRKFMGQNYEPVDLELLNIIVQQLSIAINNYYLIKHLKEANFQLSRKLVELETLYDLGIAIGNIMDVNELSEQILFNSVGLIDASAGLLALTKEGEFDITASINLPPENELSLNDYDGLTKVLKDNEPLIDNCGDGKTHPYGFGKILVVPLSGQHEVLGFIALADKESRDGLLNFTREDERLLHNFASQAGVAIENAKFYKESLEKEKMEKELQVAATIQQNILPKAPPSIPGLEIAAITIPSRFVGGDHYYFHKRGNDHLFSIADVSGKGIPAALLVSTLHATQNAVTEEEWDVIKIVKRISKSIYSSSLSNKFITYFLIHYNQDTRKIVTVNAGHNYPLLISKDGSMRKLTKGGLVLGLLPDVRYEKEETQLQPGDLLVTFTDGVNEAMNLAEEEFGDERLEELLINNRFKSAQEIFDIVMSEIKEFTAGAPQHDDITLVIYKIAD